MRIVCISDTHGFHERIVVPPGDVLVHAGDLTARDSFNEIRRFVGWFMSQPHRLKIFIAGNHDWIFERYPDRAASLIPSEIKYLEDSGCEFEGVRFWGSPVQPWFFDWAFNRQRGPDIARHWYMIPEGTDVLITHGPARGILDKTLDGEEVGCADLRRRIEILQPKAHICGHIHCGHGTARFGATQMVNASICDENYRPVQPAIVVEI